MGAMLRNIVVASYPRSGTHLTIDLVRNNLGGFEQPYISVPRRCGRTDSRGTGALVRRIVRGRRVFKTHALPNRFITPGPPQKALMAFAADSSLFIYIVRDGRDAIVSQYCRDRACGAIDDETAFSAYMWQQHSMDARFGTRVHAWAEHVNSWIKESLLPVLLLRYSDIVRCPRTSLKRISKAVMAKSTERFFDVRLSRLSRVRIPPRFPNCTVSHKVVEHTAIGFRRGQVGDFRAHMSLSDLGRFDRFMRQYEWRAYVCL